MVVNRIIHLAPRCTDIITRLLSDHAALCVCIYSRSLWGLHWDHPPWSASLSNQAPPAGAMQLLPKRPIMEKNNGAAAAVFNPSMFHYQQALANMQLQQPAFIPTGEPPHTLAWLKHHLTHWFQKGSRTTPDAWFCQGRYAVNDEVMQVLVATACIWCLCAASPRCSPRLVVTNASLCVWHPLGHPPSCGNFPPCSVCVIKRKSNNQSSADEQNPLIWISTIQSGNWSRNWGNVP